MASAKFEIEHCEIPDVLLMRPRVIADSRGSFSEVYNDMDLLGLGIGCTFVQDNQSCSRTIGTVRGLHYQVPPFAQSKLVRVVHGAILDVAVDIRPGSPTFGRSVSRVLSADNFNQLFIPEGFAHGFAVRAENTIVIYKVTNYYSTEHERGIHWNDPELNIDWGLKSAEAVLSERDEKHEVFRSIVSEGAFLRST